MVHNAPRSYLTWFFSALALRANAFSLSMTAQAGALDGIGTELSSLPFAFRTSYETFTLAFRT
jgi:hypothetical protein